MSKKPNHSTPSATDLRAIAESKVAIWQQLTTDAWTKRVDFEQYAASNPLPLNTYDYPRPARPSVALLEHLTRQIKVAEANERAAVAERAAVLALDAAELAEGDDTARLRDLPTLRDDLVACDSEIERCKQAVNDAMKKKTARVEDAEKAEVLTASRRRAAGQPFATAFVPLQAVQLGGGARTYAEQVDDAIARGLRVPGHAAAVESLRAELKRVAAGVEEQRIAAADIAKRDAERQAYREWESQELNNQMRARAEERRKEAADDAQRREQLAAATLARFGVSQ